MEDQDIVAYKSSFIPNMNINLVFKENPNYGMMRKIFDQYGYGFLAPEFKTNAGNLLPSLKLATHLAFTSLPL